MSRRTARSSPRRPASSEICAGPAGARAARVAYVAIAASALLACMPARAAGQANPATFGDWVVGCDNQRSCVAIGMRAEEGQFGAYVRIARGGARDDGPSVALAYYTDKKVSQAVLQTALAPLRGNVRNAGVPAQCEDGVCTAALAGPQAMRFVDALRDAKTLTVKLDADSTSEPSVISLNGSAAALLFVDDRQQRVGTPTALMRRGNRPVSTIADVPPLPQVRALALTVPKTLPPAASRLPKASEDCLQGVGPIAFRDARGAMLYGVCESSGAYNMSYRMILPGDRRGRSPAASDLDATTVDTESVHNPGLNADGKTINTFFKGRGLGDCGDSRDIVWTGDALVDVARSEMPFCRGVPPDAWPTTYRAVVR